MDDLNIFCCQNRDCPDYGHPPGHPGYRAGSDGSVWSRHRAKDADGNPTWQRLRPQWVKRHLRWRLCVVRPDRSVRSVYIAVLVLEAFRGPRPSGAQAAHGDGDRTNDALDNLRWATPKENSADSDRHGTRPRGERHGLAKLTEAGVRLIRRDVAAWVGPGATSSIEGLCGWRWPNCHYRAVVDQEGQAGVGFRSIRLN